MTRPTSAFATAAPVTFVTAGDGDTSATLDSLIAGGAHVMGAKI